jgi:hypothetical protein
MDRCRLRNHTRKIDGRGGASPRLDFQSPIAAG